MKKKSKGGRPATGSIKWRRNAKTGEMQWHAQITFKDGSRPFAPLDPTIPETDVEGARRCARETSWYARKHGAVVDRSRETVAHFAGRWCKWRERKGLGCVAADRALLECHVLPVLGGFDVREVAREDLKRLVAKLDAKAERGTSDEGRPFSWKTAVNAWGAADSGHHDRSDRRIVIARIGDRVHRRSEATCLGGVG